MSQIASLVALKKSGNEKDLFLTLIAQVRNYHRLGFQVPTGIKPPESNDKPVLVNYGLSLDDIQNRLGIPVHPCPHQEQHRVADQWGWVYGGDLGRKTRGLIPENTESYLKRSHSKHASLSEGVGMFIREFMPWEEQFVKEGVSRAKARQQAFTRVLKMDGLDGCANFIPQFLGSQCGSCEKAPALYLNGMLKIIYFEVSQNPCWGLGYRRIT